MEYQSVHIHKTNKSSHEHLLFLLIPSLIFILTIFYFASKAKPSQISQTSTESSVLGETNEKH